MQPVEECEQEKPNLLHKAWGKADNSARPVWQTDRALLVRSKRGIREMLMGYYCYLLSFSWSFLPAWAMTWSMVRAARRSVQPVGS